MGMTVDGQGLQFPIENDLHLVDVHLQLGATMEIKINFEPGKAGFIVLTNPMLPLNVGMAIMPGRVQPGDVQMIKYGTWIGRIRND